MKLFDIATGKWKRWNSFNGAAHVNPMSGTGKYTRSRFANLNNAGGIKALEFPASSNITYLTLYAYPVTGTTLQGDELVLIAIDPVTSALATSYLTQVESLTSDVQWMPVPINEIIGIKLEAALINGALGGGIVYAKTVGGVAINLYVGGS